jgi:ABC-type hemin transport system ATPase subunit
MAPDRRPSAIFLMGTVGAGKTTLGRALAAEIDGDHVEGDDYQQPPKPWYAASLSTARGVLRAALAITGGGRTAVVSYPLRCHEWIFYQRRLAEAGVRSVFVTLAASDDALFAPGRGRNFTGEERARIREMLEQGYGERGFADLAVRTDRGPVEDSLAELLRGLRSAGCIADPG